MFVIDAKLIPVLHRSTFEELQTRGVVAVSVVCSIWESFDDSLRNFRKMQEFVRTNSDIVYQVFDVGDLEADHARGRTGVIFSWQNSEGFGGNSDRVELFADLGLRIAQPTFIAGNAAGSGCQEADDTGLSTYGDTLVASMNEHGIAIDLSHVGNRTADDVLRASTMPPFYAQVSPMALKQSARNKSDAQMRAVADAGGVVCLTTIRHHLPSGLDSTVDDLAATVIHVRNVVGSEAVGLGSDLTPGQGPAFLDYVSRQGGHGTTLLDYEHSPTLPGFEDFDGYNHLVDALSEKGVPQDEIEAIMGRNLHRYFSRVWTTSREEQM